MAMTADSASNHHSPRGSGLPADGLTSPEVRRKGLSSPWAQVVRGEPESISAVHQSPSPSPPPPAPQPSVSEPAESSSPSKAASVATPPPNNSVSAESADANNGNAAPPKKPAWNKPSNGVVEVSPVMGASWPALSESTKPSPKSSLADSTSKTVSGRTVSSNQVPVTHSPQKQSTGNANPSSNPNRTMPARQRPKRGGSASTPGGGPTQSGFTRPSQPPQPPPSPPPFPVFPIPPNSFGNLMPPLPDPSPREPIYRGNNWETRPVGGFVSQSGPVNDHRNPSRRGNYGPRGEGPYPNNFGGRRDQDRGHYGNARDVHMQPQRGPPRGFIRPPPPNVAPFVPPQPMRPFANPMGYPELLYIPPMPMEPFRGVPGMPFIPPPPHAAVLMPVMEPNLSAMIVKQIDYYFSDANLIKDEFLKSNMDDQGWVSVTLIAGFPRVKSLTSNIQLILDSLRTSTVVEVKDDKIRRRNEWMKWIPTSSRVPSESGFPSLAGSSTDMVAASFQKITVDETAKANPHSENDSGKHSSELVSQSQLSNGEVTEDAASAIQN